MMAGLINVDATGGIREGAGAGLMVTVLDEVAKRAGFTWRNSYAVFADPELYGKTYTELIKWQISSYDLSGDWWVSSHTVTRAHKRTLRHCRRASIIESSDNAGAVSLNNLMS